MEKKVIAVFILFIAFMLTGCESCDIRREQVKNRASSFKEIAVISPDAVFIREFLTRSKKDNERARRISAEIMNACAAVIKEKNYETLTVSTDDLAGNGGSEAASIVDSFKAEVEDTMLNRFYPGFFHRHRIGLAPMDRQIVERFRPLIRGRCDGILFIKIDGVEKAGGKAAAAMVFDLLDSLSTGVARSTLVRIYVSVSLIDPAACEMLFSRSFTIDNSERLKDSICSAVRFISAPSART